VLIFVLCFLAMLCLIAAANERISTILEEVNQRLPKDGQIDFGGLGARWRTFEVLRLHSQMYPESPKRRQMWVLIVAGFASWLAIMLVLFNWPR
jgi:hypothetical protein